MVVTEQRSSQRDGGGPETSPNVDGSGSVPAGAAGSLRRSLGLADSVAIGLGAIIGAGIFVVTGVAAGIAGPSLLAGLAIAAVAATANALSSAQLAAVYPVSGGTYEYGYRVLGWPFGFAAGWMFLAGKIASAGTVALGLAGYLGVFAPGVPPRGIAVAAVIAFTLLNALGVRRSSQANSAIVTISVGALLVFTIFGFSAFDGARLQPFAPAGLGGILRSAALLFFAYTGYARIATLGEEVRDPATTIPRAVVITIAIAVVLYFAVAAVALGVAGAPALDESAAPLHAAAEETGIGWLAAVVAVGGIAAMLGVILSQLLGLSRMAYAMARRGDLPRALAHVSSRTEVPVRAILVIGTIASMIAATGSLGGVAAAASFTILLYYAIANLSALRMPADSKRFPDVVPIIGLASCVLLAFALPFRTIAIGMGLLAAGFVVRPVVREVHRRSAS